MGLVDDGLIKLFITIGVLTKAPAAIVEDDIDEKVTILSFEL